jgi:hypothetical protein
MIFIVFFAFRCLLLLFSFEKQGGFYIMVIGRLILFSVFLIFVSCQKEEIQDDSHIIMRVGATVLTENDVTAAIGIHATPEQKLSYIKSWSNRELTYQAALTLELDKEETTKRTIEDMKKNLLSIQFLQQEVGKAGVVEVSAYEIEKEFRQNQQNYTRKEPVVRVARIVMDTRVGAWQIREGLTAENFRAKGTNVSIEKIPPYEDIKFVPRSDFNPEIFPVIFGTRVTGVTSPILEDGRYSIYLILAKEDIGSPALLEEVIDNVKRNVLTKKQNQVVNDMYESLRNRYDYSYDRDYIAKLEQQQKKSAETQERVQTEMQEELN